MGKVTGESSPRPNLLQDALPGPIGLDTNTFIYIIEEHALFEPVLWPLFEAIDTGKIQAITSGVTLLEVLVKPMRCKNLQLCEQYTELLTNSRNISFVDLDRTLLRDAAALRAHFALKTPDALQLAASIRHQCTAFLTNDRKLPQNLGIKLLELNAY